MNLSSITRVGHRTALKLKKHSPQILFYGGIVGTVATTVLASRATLRAVPVFEELKHERALLEEDTVAGRVEDEEFTNQAVRQYTIAGMKLTKLYAPSVIIGVASIAALTKSHQQLVNRNSALTVAYTGLFKTFQNYRERVREDHGVLQDQQYLHGTVVQEYEVEGKNGKISKKELVTLDPSSAAALTYYFNESSASWVPDPGYNQTMIDGTERWANVVLDRQGHLFLNEVFDMMGLPHTMEGQVLGWVKEDLGNNDTFVSFGHHADGEFLAGYTKDVMLNFNIHGPILDLI